MPDADPNPALGPGIAPAPGALRPDGTRPRNVVVCCDGTANEVATDATSVVKLFRALEKGSPRQACFYHPGVGTMAPPGFVTGAGAAVARVAGLAFGYGLTADLRDAYVYIANTYRPGDKLFLFGFSRGAYTVRALASMLHLYGLIERGNEPLVPYVVRMLWAVHALDRKRAPGSPPGPPGPRLAGYLSQAAGFKAAFSSVCQPHFVGVWDTVSSVGWFTSPVSLPFTASNADIAIGRHAVAIDEHRAFFRSNLWRPAADPAERGPRDLRQVWFPGAHCDVGGGYPERDSGLSKIALGWMMDEARSAGLLLDEAAAALVLGAGASGAGCYARPDPDATLHDSLTRWWRPAEWLPRPHRDAATGRRTWRANRFKRRELPPGAVVHDAAWARGGGYAGRLPAGAVRLSQAGWPVPEPAGGMTVASGGS